jgi:hypothetical protein
MGTVPLALSSPSRESRVVGAVCTSVPSPESPITLVTLARSPSGAPGAGALAMTSPTATGPCRSGLPGVLEEVVEGLLEGTPEGVDVPLPVRDMTARPV